MTMEAAPIPPSDSVLHSSEATNLERQIDHVLSRYVSVWLWSLLFGADTTLVFSIGGFFRSGGAWRQLTVLIGLSLFIAAILALACMYSLFLFFSKLLIPEFFNRSWVKRDSKDDSYAFQEINREADRLKHAFSFLLYGFAFVLFAAVLQFVFASIR